MTHDPRTEDTIYEDLRDSLEGKITELTNFTDRSFNYVWTRAHAEELRRLEVLSLVAEMAGFIDFTGKEVEEEDLEALGVANTVSPDEVNELMEDNYLDEFVKIVGVERFGGAKATGEVTINTQSDPAVTIPEGTRVTTEPDRSGETLDFVTTEQDTAGSNSNSVTVNIEAAEIGPDYNLSSGSIVRFADPPQGVTGVTQNNETTGGESEESNEELRSRAKDAVAGSSEGGTVEGIKAFIRQNIESVGGGNVIIEEFVDQQPPYVDVIVDGGEDTEVEDTIDTARPAGIRHNLVRPQEIEVDIRADLTGTDIGSADADTSDVESNLADEIDQYLTDMTIDEDYYYDDIISFIMGLDNNIVNIDYYDPVIATVSREQFTYDSSQTEYPLDFTYESTNVSAVADDGGSTTDESTEANNDAIDDMTLLPSSPSAGDAYYFGFSQTVDNVWIDISTAGSGTWSITWEYYTEGGSWSALSNVNDGTNAFRNSGTNTASWDNPTDWSTTSVGGISGLYWVRARLDSFSSISTQPKGKNAGSQTVVVEDEDETIYTESVGSTTEDYDIQSQSPDGYAETIVWEGNSTPDDGDTFTIDYTVTRDSTNYTDRNQLDLIRDEAFTYNLSKSETFQFDDSIDLYELDAVPYDGTSQITDNSGDSYTEGTEYEIIDDSGNGFKETIDWSGGNAEPSNNEEFTITYEKKVYHTTYEIVETPNGEIRTLDGSGNTISFVEGTDYELVDYNTDDEDDAIEWSKSSGDLSPDLEDGDEFYITYFNEGDLFVQPRQKVAAGDIEVNI